MSTEATDAEHALAPLPFADDAASAQARARAALAAEPRTRIVVDRPGYLRAEARSRLFRFVDDVEIVVDAAAGRYRLRSASRVGESDLGVNRERAERLRARLASPERAGTP